MIKNYSVVGEAIILHESAHIFTVIIIEFHGIIATITRWKVIYSVFGVVTCFFNFHASTCCRREKSQCLYPITLCKPIRDNHTPPGCSPSLFFCCCCCYCCCFFVILHTVGPGVTAKSKKRWSHPGSEPLRTPRIFFSFLRESSAT